MGFGDWLTKGGFHITDDQRDPKSRLGRANPHSLHLRGDLYQKGFGTYDVRPRKGMTYEQYIDRIKADGWNIIQAQNEVKNPSRHATGPHWHVAVDGRKEQQPMASPLSDMLKNSPAFMQPQQQPGGSLASYLQAPITDEPLQKAVMPGDRPGFEMAPLPGVKPKGRGTANDIIGSLGDFLASAFGGQPQYWNSVNEQQQLETEGRQRLAQRQADRKTALEDWMFQQQYKRQNPDPSSMENDLSAWNRMTPQQQAQYAAMMDVKSPIAVSGPQGTYRVPRGFGQPTNAPTVQPGAVEDGYQFTGGDPSNPSSWRKVQ